MHTSSTPNFSYSELVEVSSHSIEEDEEKEMPSSRLRAKKRRPGNKRRKSNPELLRLLQKEITTLDSTLPDNYDSDLDTFKNPERSTRDLSRRGPISRTRRRKSKKEARITNLLPTVIENDIDDYEYSYFATQVLSTVEQIEDTFDRNTYEDLIPLNIRMALENRLFGWNHLYSIFLGHICFPLLYYTVTFAIVSLIGLKFTPSSSESYCYSRCSANCMFHKIYFNGNHTANLNAACNHDYEYTPILRISNRMFLTLRQVLSIWSAFNAFRTVRRRRRVWLRSTAAEYFKDKNLQDEMKEVDKKTLLGRIRRKMRARKIKKKIKKAQIRFQKRENIRMKKIISNINTFSFETEHHRNVKNLSGVNETSMNSFDYESDSSLSIKDITNLSQPYTINEPDPNHLFKAYEKYKHARQDNDPDEPSRHFHARTMPTFAIQSINMDQIRLKSRIENVAYAHGGFFGAAPFMLANPHWIDILRQLMPDVYVEISRRAVLAPVPQLIHWAENNPVVAAYGTAHELEFSGKVPTLEWDVFLDPHLVQRVEVVLEAREIFLKEIAKSSQRINTLLNEMECRYADKIKAITRILESGISKRSDECRIVEFYNAEIEKRIEVLLEKMLIAHGNATQLLLEQTGYLKNLNFSRVKHTRRTLGGGIYAKHWIPLFVQALKMSTKSSLSTSSFTKDSSDESTSSSEDGSFLNEQSPSIDKEAAPLLKSDSHSGEKTSFEELGLSLISPSSIADSISELKQVTDCDAPLGLILDLKSRHVPKRVWALLIDAFRKAGARIEGIATFSVEDIRDVSKYCSVDVKEMVFYHSAGDLQYACHNGMIRKGDSIFFNAGSLFWNHPVRELKDIVDMMGQYMCFFDAEETKQNYKMQPYARVRQCTSKEGLRQKDTNSKSNIDFFEGGGSTIQQYKEKYDLSIGLYVQEFCVDDQILEMIIEYVNRNQHVYNLGFSWGGINGLTVKDIQPGRLTSTDGLWNQRYLGHEWGSDKCPLNEE